MLLRWREDPCLAGAVIYSITVPFGPCKGHLTVGLRHLTASSGLEDFWKEE